MYSRRFLLLGAVASATSAAATANAFEFLPYAASAVDKAISAGKPVIIHVYASWCLQCHAQASILSGLAGDRRLDGIRFFRVDYDDQKDIVSKLGVSRSTLIAYKGGKEVSRMSWGTSQDDVVRVLQAAL
jgi:thiol-disulfide isomerase/thioredoxin